MITALDLKQGMALRIEGQIYKVLDVEAKAGTAKLGGVVKTKLCNVSSGRMWEPHFRPQERLEDLQLERHMMEFLFADADLCTFMHPETFEQVEISRVTLGPGAQLLESGMQLPVEFYAGLPISAVFPDIVETRVVDTVPPVHTQQDSAWKEASLENGLNIRVPLFVAPGEVVRVDLRSGRYMERVRSERKRSA
jgi:elongation factor P